MRRLPLVLVALLAASFLCLRNGARAQHADPLQPTVFAVRGARVVTEPGHVLPAATVVVRDGRVEAVGKDVKPPADALVIEGKGLTVYPGFIDACSHWGFDAALRRSQVGDPGPVDYASAALAATNADNRKGMTPEFQVGTALKDDTAQADTWRKAGFTAHLIAPEGGFFTGQSAVVSLSGAPPREALLRPAVALHAAFRPVGGTDYPRVLMGLIAHCRQTLLDAERHRQLRAAHERAGDQGPRPPVDPALDALAPALAGRMPVVFEADTRDEIGRVLDFAREFHLRPILHGGRDAWKEAARLKQLDVPVLLRLNFTDASGRRTARRQTMFGMFRAPQEDETDLPRRVREDEKRLLLEDVRNAAILARRGVRFAFSTQGQPADRFRESLHKLVTEGGLPPDIALRALTVDAAHLLGVDRQIGTIAAGKAAHLVVATGDLLDPKTRVRHVFADTAHFEYEDQPTAEARGPEARRPGGRRPRAGSAAPAGNDQPTELEADRKPKLHTGGNVLLRGATVLTVTHGTLPATDILVRHGKIAEIGKHLTAPAGVTVIPADGMFVMPGIIDTHCHFAISGGVNEFSLSIVPEVRVRDVIASDDVQIYRALAGGVTTSRLLHGSANVVGGQDAVVKLKYGLPAHELLIPEAPRGVKFALGENVKQTPGRFPNTRLGVEAVLVRAFTEARAYRQAWHAYQDAKAAGKPAVPPRRDLRLEALADVLDGELKVHCHCYRQDEILMLLNTATRFGFKIKSLQHVLEGYKIAAEIADHGASCSTFSDWWAFKMETYDAIPFNAALLTEAGASVCIKSDSNELMRHLYQEAAKCVKYGGMSEDAALATITLNGAKQLGIDGRTGSIDVGKDADLAVFNGHPLNSYSRPEMTLVEGEVYFQRADRVQPNRIAVAGPAKPAPALKEIPRNATGSYALTGVTVHPVSRPPIEGATVVIRKGRIADVFKGAPDEQAADAADHPAGAVAVNGAGKVATHALPAGTSVIPCGGLHLYPGMIDAASVLGLVEVGAVRETHDFQEAGTFHPDLRASVGLNPDSALIPVTRANGVTTVVTRPEGGVISGQGTLIDLAGWVAKEMVVRDQVVLHVELPRAAPRFRGGRPGGPTPPSPAEARKANEEKVRRLKELFRQAVAYDKGRKQSPATPVNPGLEALVPYARGRRPVVIDAQRRKEILEALKLGDELKLKVVVAGGIEAWKVADELKKRQVPVIVGPVMQLPLEQYDPYDAPYACPARLHEAGVPFCICIHSVEMANERNLPYEAATAVAYGLPAEEGLKAVTLYPAQILGVADEVGSIDAGKRANLVLTNGDLLQATTQVVGLFIDGRPLPPTSKHTRLYERYRERLREVREGRAVLGTR